MALDQIVAVTREVLARAQQQVSRAQLEQRPLYLEPRRGFAAALRRAQPAVIAEIKHASPSRGLIRPVVDPAGIARGYAAAGAAALSVLTEERFFHGQLQHLATVRAAVALPLLRKDFVLDQYQIVEARAWGADAVLLIVAILDDAALRELLLCARDTGVDALVEVHTAAELEQALAAGAQLIGVNNRDLRTLVTSLATAERLRPLIPPGVTVVAESGIETSADLARLRTAGFDAFLIGESLMRAPDPGAQLATLLRGGSSGGS